MFPDLLKKSKLKIIRQLHYRCGLRKMMFSSNQHSQKKFLSPTSKDW